MRVALIRGSAQRNYELPNYEFGENHSVDLFVSRRLRLGEHSSYFGVRRLPAASDLTLHMGPRARGALELTLGPLEYLFGLEGALAGFDVAHTFEIAMPLTVQALKARDRGAVKRVVATVFENIPFKAEPNAWVRQRAEQAAAAVDHFVCVSEQAKLHLQVVGVPDDRISIIPFGTDIDRFRPVAHRRPGAMRVLCSARLELAKGVEDLVIAVGLLARRGLVAELILAGSGPSEGRLRKIAARMGIVDQVSFRAEPWVAMPDVYRDADVFVLASAPTRNWREQFGFAVIEALATGLPVLVGGSGALPEVVGRDDVLVRPHDPMDLAAKLEALIEDPNRLNSLGEWNRRLAVARYDQRAIAQQLLELYGQVLSRSVRG